MPYNKNEKIGKISDFISAATLAAKEKERELEKNEFQKKRDAENALKAAKNKQKKPIVESDKDGDGPEEDEMDFTTIKDNRVRQIKDQGKGRGGGHWAQNSSSNWRGRQRGGRGGHHNNQNRPAGGQKAKSKKDLAK